MPNLYVLVVDKAWAKLYKTCSTQTPLNLVYHQALFGGRPAGGGADEELARNLCRLLRADRQTRKFDRLVMFASADMLDALRRQYDGEWRNVTVGRIEDLPARYTDEDLSACLARLLARHDQAGSGMAVLLD